MWLAPIAQLLALSAMASQPEAATSAMSKPIATRQTFFGIPFRVEPADQAWREPVEVQLFVSGDQGRTWQLYSKVEPLRRRFMFRAGTDGEFWFLIRTLDRSGQFWPRRPRRAEMKVVVDTMPPKLDLQAVRGQAGQIIAQWKIDDPHTDLGTLILQYRTTSNGPWQEVAVERRSSADAGSPQTGQVIWWPQADSGVIQIRAEVSDTAGNLAVSHAQLKPGKDGRRPDRTAQKPLSSWRAGQSTGGLGAADRVKVADNRSDLANDRARVVPIGPGELDRPSASANDGHTGYGFQPSPDQRSPDQPYPNTGASQPIYPHTGSDTPLSLSGPDEMDRPTGALVSNFNPPIQHQYVPSGGSPGNRFDGGLPPGRRPRMVNSRRFHLEYDVTSVGSSGISRVELWGTQDGGQSWRRLALDDDNRSPLLVEVDREGIYGLKVVVTSGAGLGGRRPQSGEFPELVVGVDLTKPTARITAARPGTGAKSGNLIISWKADDQQLAARPVSLLFSEKPGGPWTPIASSLENTGRYNWAVDYRVPEGVYLRIEVRDEAGNVGAFETAEPVSLDRFQPAAQIRGVRSVGDSRRTPASRYYIQ